MQPAYKGVRVTITAVTDRDGVERFSQSSPDDASGGNESSTQGPPSVHNALG